MTETFQTLIAECEQYVPKQKVAMLDAYFKAQQIAIEKQKVQEFIKRLKDYVKFRQGQVGVDYAMNYADIRLQIDKLAKEELGL